MSKFLSLLEAATSGSMVVGGEKLLLVYHSYYGITSRVPSVDFIQSYGQEEKAVLFQIRADDKDSLMYYRSLFLKDDWDVDNPTSGEMLESVFKEKYRFEPKEVIGHYVRAVSSKFEHLTDGSYNKVNVDWEDRAGTPEKGLAIGDIISAFKGNHISYWKGKITIKDYPKNKPTAIVFNSGAIFTNNMQLVKKVIENLYVKTAKTRAKKIVDERDDPFLKNLVRMGFTFKRSFGQLYIVTRRGRGIALYGHGEEHHITVGGRNLYTSSPKHQKIILFLLKDDVRENFYDFDVEVLNG